MKKEVIVYGCLFVFLLSCKNNDDTVRFRALNEALVSYRQAVDGDINNNYDELKGKLQDPQTASKANLWQPKAVHVKQLADSLHAYINTLCASLAKEARPEMTNTRGTMNEEDHDAVILLFEKQGKANELFEKIRAFNEASVNVLNPDEFNDNPIVQADLAKVKEGFKKIAASDTGLHDMYFKGATAAGALTMLNKLQNDVSINERRIINYCNLMTIRTYHGFDELSPIAVLNSSYLKAGQPLEVTVAVGAYSLASGPSFTINGKNIAPGIDGAATYTIIAGGKPGKHFIPVTISFYRPDGVQTTVSKKLAYTIAE